MQITNLTLIAIACLVTSTSCTCRLNWLRLETKQCLSDSLAFWTAPLSSVHHCALAAEKTDGLLVVQFDADTRQCALFQYIAMCHLIDALASNGINTLHSCAAFANARAVKFMKLSRKLMSSVGSKLHGAWVMSDDSHASKSNLVCGQTQQWKSESVEFIREGAKFNGVSSKMWLEGVEFANLKQGLTWLIRLKRVTPREATLFETYTCDTMAIGAGFWDGHASGWGLLFFRFNYSAEVYITGSATHTFDPNDFVELGVTSLLPQSPSFYSKAGIVPVSSVSHANTYAGSAVLNCYCLRMGFRPGDSRILNGTVQAVAIVNDTMTGTEISSFFGLVRSVS